MIILQILTGIILIPLTLATAVLFNVYIRHWLYYLAVFFYGLVYSAFWSLVTLSPIFGSWMLMSLCLLYLVRMYFLASRYHGGKSGTWPTVKGNIRVQNTGFHLVFLFPLAFIRVLKLIPGFVSRNISRKSGLKIDFSQLIDMILINSVGTKIDVSDEDNEIYFEIF